MSPKFAKRLEQYRHKYRAKVAPLTDTDYIIVKPYSSYIGQDVKIQIDRPLGSKHPKHGFVYSLNYGFVPNTKAPDGEEIDAYVLGIDTPLKEFTGKCIAVIHRTNDDDDKLVVAPVGYRKISNSEIKVQTHFQEQYFESEIVRKTNEK